jgi:hypothetical protein
MPQHIRELVGKRPCNSKYGHEYRELPIIVTILNSLKDMSRFYMCRRSAVI